MGKRKASQESSDEEDNDTTMIVVHNPYGPRNGLLATSTEIDRHKTRHWLERIFGEGSVADMSAISTEKMLVVTLFRSVEAIDPYLGSHIWGSFLTSTPNSEDKSLIFLLRKEQWKFVQRNWKSVLPSSASAPPSLWLPKFKDPYPHAGPADVPLNDRKLSRPLDASRPQRNIHPPIPSTSAVVAARLKTQGQSLPNFQPTTSGTKRDSTSAPMDKIFEEKLLRHHHSEHASGSKEAYIVLYNRMGVLWDRPIDFTCVLRWLESRQLFGAGATLAFWARPLDLRLIVQLRADDAKLGSMVGIHEWDQCLVGYMGLYPHAIKDRRTHLHILRRNLWGHLIEEGFQRFEVERHKLRTEKWMSCVAREPYPTPQKGEPPDYYDGPDIQVLGEPSSEVL